MAQAGGDACPAPCPWLPRTRCPGLCPPRGWHGSAPAPRSRRPVAKHRCKPTRSPRFSRAERDALPRRGSREPPALRAAVSPQTLHVCRVPSQPPSYTGTG